MLIGLKFQDSEKVVMKLRDFGWSLSLNCFERGTLTLAMKKKRRRVVKNKIIGLFWFKHPKFYSKLGGQIKSITNAGSLFRHLMRTLVHSFFVAGISVCVLSTFDPPPKRNRSSYGCQSKCILTRITAQEVTLTQGEVINSK